MNLPAALQDGQWQPINQGLSGASILRGAFAGRSCFLKITPHTHRMPVKAEYARLQWLKGRIPVADVVAYMEDATHQYLVNSAVDGVEALSYDADPDTLIRHFASAIRRFHDLPIAECPFTWTVDEQIAFARATVDANEVSVSLMDTEFRGRDLEGLLQEMIALRPAQPDLVVAHGDPYNDNVLLYPGTGAVAAFIDVGFAGVADRYTDFAMIYDVMVHTFGNAGWEKFLQYYGLVNLDSQRLHFYRLFNEFI